MTSERARVLRLASQSLTYSPVGASQQPAVAHEPPDGYRGRSATARIGLGEARWNFASREVMHWGVKTRSGFRVDATGPAGEGDDLIVRFGAIREPVRVVAVIDELRRRGFSYGTLPGHPIRGEETFVVEHKQDDSVWLTVSSFSRSAQGLWGAAYPVLLLAQRVFLARYLRALAGPLSGPLAGAAGGER
jgi:uncharacterized protein (UPF0548 family)